LNLARKFPSSAEEGGRDLNKNVAKQPLKGAAGVVLVKQNMRLL